MAVTILELAEHRGARRVDDRINGGEFYRVGVDIMGGCSGCHATLAAYNAYPSKRGFWMCADCIGDSGYATVVEANAAIFDGIMPPRPKVRGDLDRSVAFSILLDVFPGYAESVDDGGKSITAFLVDWYEDPSLDMYEFARRWIVGKTP